VISRPGPFLFVALLVGSVVVAAIGLNARTPDLAIEVTRLTREIDPTGTGPQRVAHIRFFVRESDPDATVEIVGPDLRRIRTLARQPLVANEPVSFTWNGRTNSGALANPADRYRLRVLLPNRERDMVYPRRISVRSDGLQ
jgi:hypothetical protein